jgi:hypothetical protein
LLGDFGGVASVWTEIRIIRRATVEIFVRVESKVSFPCGVVTERSFVQ